MIGNNKWRHLNNAPQQTNILWGKGKELDGVGCLRLLHETVKHAVNKKTGKKREIERAEKASIHFAKNSKLLHHFCDLFEYDYNRVKNAILNNN